MGDIKNPRVILTLDHKYLVDGREVPGVTSIIKDAGLVNYQSGSDWAMDRGSAVHLACELYDRGCLDPSSIDPRIEGHLEAWKRFLHDMQPTFLGIEEIVYSTIHDYAGKADRIAKLGDALAIIDIKTGPLNRIVGVQLAAYAMAYAPRTRVRRIGVHLSDDGSYRTKEFTDWNDYKIFLAALTIRQWRKEERGE